MSNALSKRTVLVAAMIALIYIVFSIYLMNFKLVKDTLIGDFPLTYKFNLLLALLEGMWTAMSFRSLFVLILMGALTGINSVIIIKKIYMIGRINNMQFMVGGSSLLGIVGSGCASCGLPILSILGLSGAAFYLPFHGTELSYVGLVLLSFSLFMLLRKTDTTSCRIKQRRK